MTSSLRDRIAVFGAVFFLATPCFYGVLHAIEALLLRHAEAEASSASGHTGYYWHITLAVWWSAVTTLLVARSIGANESKRARVFSFVSAALPWAAILLGANAWLLP